MEKENDLFRDTLLRYLGYSNEVGEAFRHIVSKHVVRGSYAIATGYVIADTIDKTNREYKRTYSGKSATITAADVFLWQMLASVAIPGFTINRISFLSRRLLENVKAKKSVAKFLPVAVGLASIPIIIHPIDNFTDHFMDYTFRKIFKKS